MSRIGFLAILAATASLVWASPVLAQDVKKDTGDTREIRQDRRDLYKAKESGNPTTVADARNELREDKRDRRQDVRDLRQDKRDRRQDLKGN